MDSKQAQQDPVAYAVYHRMGGGKSLHWPEQHSPNGDANEYQLVPLYAFQPPKRTLVRLSDEEWQDIADDEDNYTLDAIKDAIEAKLMEKNYGN